MANAKVRLRFLAMERSLRATGCQLPLVVIPYDDNIFDLPANSTWLPLTKISQWLQEENAHLVMRKYECLAMKNYQFVDADVCFLRNPEQILQSYEGFVTSCGHWHNPAQTITNESRALMLKTSTIYQSRIFNTGQFACDRQLYDYESLRKTASQPDFTFTCIKFPFHEQPGINLLVWASGVTVTNLTLPPSSMESTWAGDYPNEFEHYWQDPEHKPYLMHWAGVQMDKPHPINQIFYDFLTSKERIEWDEQEKIESQKRVKQQKSLRAKARRVKRNLRVLITQ